MPVVLAQLYSPADRVYEDVEYSLYHYPRQYFSRVRPYDVFVYYRPLGKTAPRPDSKTYFGHGVLGQWWPDPVRADHRYVPIVQAEPFRRFVPICDRNGDYFETESVSPPPFQSAVRELSQTAYWKILAAGDVKSAGLSLLPSTENIAARPYAASIARDDLRPINAIPPGAGYKPKGDNRVNVFESAALQERARGDHQRVLQLVQERVMQRGGATWYNNNIDLFARLGESRMLIEAKSLLDVRASFDRARYGIGQLADYDFRYRRQLDSPTKVLAFGSDLESQTAYIGALLEDQHIALIVNCRDDLVPLNEAARSLPLF